MEQRGGGGGDHRAAEMRHDRADGMWAGFKKCSDEGTKGSGRSREGSGRLRKRQWKAVHTGRPRSEQTFRLLWQGSGRSRKGGETQWKVNERQWKVKQRQWKVKERQRAVKEGRWKVNERAVECQGKGG